MSSSNPQRVSTSGTTPGSAAFSYAQAAKGRSASVPSATVPSQGGDTASNDSPSATPAEEPSASTKDTSVSGSSNHSVSGQEQRRPMSVEESTSKPNASPESRAKGATASPSPSGPPQPAASESASPNLGARAVPALPKDDEAPVATNVPSDSTWDKQSQWSNSVSEAGDQAASDRGRSKRLEENNERSAALVAAPVPAVNVWQQRKEAQAAKTKRPGGPVQERSGEAPAAEGAKHVGTMDEPQNAALTNGGGKDKVKTGASERPREEGTKKSLPPRNKEKEAPTSPAPPPVADPSSWPTPDIAKDEGKKKPQEKSERTDRERAPAGSAKPHGKEKWTPVPYTPTVVFETQLSPRKPPRSGRGGREGGRGGGPSPMGSYRGERAPSSSGPPFANAGAADEANNRGRRDAPQTKAAANTAIPPPASVTAAAALTDSGAAVSTSDHNPKRATSAGPHSSQEQRKPLLPPGSPEKRRDSEWPSGKNSERRFNTSSRRLSSATQTDNGASKARFDSRPYARGEAGYPLNWTTPSGTEKSQQIPYEDQASQMVGYDGRSEGAGRGPDAYHPAGSQQGGARDRGEQRGGDRNRGAFRNVRDNVTRYTNAPHHHPPPASLPNGSQPGHVSTSSFAQPSKTPTFGSFNPPHARQASTSQTTASLARSRSHRQQSRSPTRPSHASFGRYATIAGAPPPISQIQTQVAPVYDYPPMQAMSAVPFSPYVEHYSVLSMVSMQMEYYFSVDNLCKDLFLRRHMDSQGFVFLNVIANFNRIRQLTQDIELLRYACYQSRTIELFQGRDGLDRLRRREGWQQWVLAAEERDPSVRDEEPAVMGPPHTESSSAAADGRFMEPRRKSGPSSVELPQYGDRVGNDPTYGMSNGSTLPIAPTSYPPILNGPVNGEIILSKPALSAAVPDFSPSAPYSGHTEREEVREPTPIDAFSDAQVDSLMMVIRDPNYAQIGAPRHPEVIRTFSNGSIDEETIGQIFGEKQTQAGPRPESNGAPPAGHVSRQANSTPPANVSKRPADTASPPVFWMKDRETPTESFPPGVLHESYNTWRKNALEQRELSAAGSCPVDMNLLYDFWSHFLVRNFNTRMYEEFRNLAVQDYTQRHTDVGLKHLLSYYDASLLGQKPITDKIARDYVGLAEREEAEPESLGFSRLRNAWRNAALNLKNRKRLETHISVSLRTRLDG